MNFSEQLVEALARIYWLGSGDTAPDPVPVQIPIFEKVWDVVEELRSLPGIGGLLVAALADWAESEDEVAFLAAGPVEDLLRYEQMRDLQTLSIALPMSPRLQDCLYRVNDPEDDQPLKWLMAQRERFPRRSTEND